jgi:glyoxylase-like metal-dependent hydrolase (beta-lactamase superfamily II)
MSALPAVARTVSIGSVRMTYLPDGSIRLPPAPLYEFGDQSLFNANQHLLDDEGFLVMSMGALLLESAGRRILVDLAWGPSDFDLGARDQTGYSGGCITGGELLNSLATYGLSPAEIDTVVFTHLHADHVGWLLEGPDAGASPTFPNATYRLAQAELDHWIELVPQGFWGGPTQPQLDVLVERAEVFEDGQVLAPGIDVLLTAGHTPGHTSFVISSTTERAVVLGDTIHCPLEISHPELALLSDVDRVAGAAVRARLRAEFDSGTIAVGGHFPDFVFGRVVQTDSHRTLVAL